MRISCIKAAAGGVFLFIFHSGAQASALPHDMSPLGMFFAADQVVKSVLIGLLVAALATWVVLLVKGASLLTARRAAAQAVAMLKSATSLPDAAVKVEGAGSTSLAQQLLAEVQQELSLSHANAPAAALKERAGFRQEQFIAQQVRAMTQGIGLLASIGSLQSDGWLGSRPVAMTMPEDTATRSRQVIQEWMQRRGIDTNGMLIDNGSGLSRTGRIAPLQLAGVLQAMQQSVWAPEFQSSLPIVALDGTMRKRLLGSPAASRARIKTGTLKNVVAIAGYVPDANNQLCVVVAMINSDLVGNGNGRAAVDALIEWVARTGTSP